MLINRPRIKTAIKQKLDALKQKNARFAAIDAGKTEARKSKVMELSQK